MNLKDLADLNNEIYSLFIGGESPFGCWNQPGWVGEKTKIMFIGQNPGMTKEYEPFEHKRNQEIYRHYVLMSPTGEFIDEILKNCNLTWDEITYTNLVKVPTRGNNTPSSALAQKYLPYLEKQITIIQPQFLVVFGKFAGYWFGMEEFYMIRHYKNIFMTMMPHPSYLLRFGTKELKQELKKIKNILGYILI